MTPELPAAAVDVPGEVQGFTTGQIQEALAAARPQSAAAVAVLEDLSGLAPLPFVERLAATFGLPIARPQDLLSWVPAFDLLPYGDAIRTQLLAFRVPARGLVIVLGDPFESRHLAWAEESIRAPFETALAHHTDIAAYLSRHEEGLSAMESLPVASADAQGAEAGSEDLSFKSITEDRSPVVRLVRSTLYDALKTHASDIHLETTPAGLGVRYRIDGVLSTTRIVSTPDVSEQVISRIKVMSLLDISERRVPQDGRFTVSVRGREIDFRVSIMPSIHGEDAVLRILDKQRLADEARGLSLDSLGFGEADRAVIRRLAARPYGMLLVTGPTGSGKTTSLYAAISETQDSGAKTVTIEDPVEYQLPGVLQIPVNERKGLTFARGLRSILRHDPDRVMVGEIRDAETAVIAVQAALTGHLVFTTVHANNVFDVLGRFTHMDVDPYAFASALNGIVAQRLVRLSCPHCVTPDVVSDERLAAAGLDRARASRFRFMSGKGCGQCRNTGYLGRTAIAEIMLLTDELREMIVARQPIRALKEVATRGGTRFLREAAVELVRDGRTNLEEIDRVVSPMA